MVDEKAKHIGSQVEGEDDEIYPVIVVEVGRRVDQSCTSACIPSTSKPAMKFQLKQTMLNCWLQI